MLRIWFYMCAALIAPVTMTAQGTLPPPSLMLRRDPAVIPLVAGAERPTINVKIHGKESHAMVLDTGAGGGMIDSAIAAQFGMEVVGRSQVASPGGQPLQVDIVSSGSLVMGDAEVVTPMSSFPMRARGLPSDGVLSFRVFASAVMSLDLSGGTLTVSHNWLVPGAAGVMPYTIDRGIIALPASIGARKITLHIDTGNRSNFTLPRYLMDSLPLKAPAVPGPEVRLISGPSKTWKGQLNGTIRIGSIEARDPEIMFIDLDAANIGSAFVRQYVLTIDQSHQLVRLVKKPATAPASSDTLSAAVRTIVIDSLASQLRRFYFDRNLGDSLGAYLRQRAAAGAFDAAVMPDTFASQLSREMHMRIRNDPHLTVRYSAPAAPAANSYEQQRRDFDNFVRDAHEESYGYPEVRTLPGNVGYWRIGEFMYQAYMSGQPFGITPLNASMQLLADRDALILDLRENGGGHTSIPPLLLAFFSDSASGAAPHFSKSKPVYVLTSRATFSAGEGIALSLKSSGRGTLVGQQTRGGYNSGDFHPIGYNFRAFIPDEQHAGPGGKIGEAVGISPDVVADSAKALDVAYRLALQALARTEPDSARREKLRALIR